MKLKVSILISLTIAFAFLVLLPPIAPLPANSNITIATDVIPRHLNSNSTSSSSLECIDLADFFYEIVLALSSFPPASCSEKEEIQISTFLQHRLNDILKKTPGTISTKNKLCDHAINNRRLLLQQSQWNLMEPFHSWFHSFEMMMDQDPHHHHYHRMLLRSFVYVGGGRCRFCFHDSNDHRRQLLSNGIDNNIKSIKRDLLQFDFYDDDGDNEPVPKVSDPIFCNRTVFERLYFFGRNNPPSGWTNEKVKTIKGAPKEYRLRSILGPYVAGESFGRTFPLEQQHGVGQKPKRSGPVKGLEIHFQLWAFDVPQQYTHKILGDEPLYLFINGIKLDFNVLLKVPGANSGAHAIDQTAEENTFAGIRWFVREEAGIKSDLMGPQKDRKYYFQLDIPSILFENVAENKLHLEFFIKPEAKAKSYGIDELEIEAHVADCEIIGIEKSPFDEFKVIMERRLEEQLGLDLARRFQNKHGHCLKDKVPMVGVHLVQKDKWNDANPRC